MYPCEHPFSNRMWILCLLGIHRKAADNPTCYWPFNNGRRVLARGPCRFNCRFPASSIVTKYWPYKPLRCDHVDAPMTAWLVQKSLSCTPCHSKTERRGSTGVTAASTNSRRRRRSRRWVAALFWRPRRATVIKSRLLKIQTSIL